MKSSSYGFIRAVVILLASATLTLAQTSGNYNGQAVQPESIHPGSLNYVEGQVSAGGETLTPQAVGHFTLQPGESMQTGNNGYAEVLLTPGAFLRVGPNSDFSIPQAGLAYTRINLMHGEAMIEADQIIKGTRLSVGLGNDSAEVLQKGLYSFNASDQAVQVLDGKLKVIGIKRSRDIGKNEQVLLAGNDNLKQSGFNPDRAKEQPLYVWSEARNRTEAEQDAALAHNEYGYGYAPVATGWFWNPYAGYYGFWPADAYLYSPFGFGFGFGYGYPGFYGGYYGRYRVLHVGTAAGVHAYSGFQGHAFAGGGGGFHGGGGGGRR